MVVKRRESSSWVGKWQLFGFNDLLKYLFFLLMTWTLHNVLFSFFIQFQD